MSSDSYLREAIKVAEQFHELDDSPLLESGLISRYQQMIGILRWSCELGRTGHPIGSLTLVRVQCCPLREGHSDAVYHLFAYLRKYNSAAINLIQPCRILGENLFTTIREKSSMTQSLNLFQRMYLSREESLCR